METRTVEWWRRHGWTIALLLLAFGIAFAIRTIWSYPIIDQFGALYTYAGGSDSYYHSRVMTYIIQTHRNLVYDPMLKFPVGSINPREPLFDWSNAILGIVFAPFFGGNSVTAGAWFLDLQAPLWAALQVFPIYLIGREVSSKRNGLIAALVYPFFSASINTSTFGYADYQSFYTFFLLVVIYSFLRTVKAIGHRRYVESYRRPGTVLAAGREFLRTERGAVKWSVFTGVALGAFALSWQGYTYAIIVVAFTVLIAMLIERIRRVDSFGLYVSTWIIGLIAFPMAAPYYIVQHEIKVFLELPIILFFGTLLLLLPFLLLRDVPWVFSIPTLLAVVGIGVLGLRFLSPTLFSAAITGDGYFVKSLIYSTVAEAQAPSIDQLVVGYGIVTFFLAFAGLALFGYQLVRQRYKRHLIALLIFGVISIYLPISAEKFFLVAAPAFALLSAEAIHRLLDVGGYPQLRRAVASLSDRTGSLGAFRRSFKARHVLVLALAVGILLPNIWISIDAGIPSNTKDAFAVQINNTIPSWLKLNNSAPASNYLGAAGSGLDTPNQYDSAGYNWLATQDTGLAEPDRPALIAWWDYGFQTIDQGEHPSVADNFQNGIDPAGQFLLSQNESLAIGILATTLLQGVIQSTHDPTLPTGLNQVLASDGVNVTELHVLLDDEAADYQTVVRNPDKYLPVNPNTITYDNAMYLAVSYYLADHFTLNGVARIYDSLQTYTGWSIRYALTDSRTFPFSGDDTGIFYAPADLTGRVISSEGIPTSFFNVSILGSDGTTYPLGPLPAGVTAAQYNINYSAPFYNTMLYRIYIGYNGTDAGQSGGIPGLTGAAAGDPIEPGWMLQHFEVAYQTAYYCPGVVNASASSSCFVATNRPNAIAQQAAGKATANLSAIRYFQGGESILTYYPGQTLYGTVALPDGAPVPGVRVTVYDGWGIPHMTNITNANGLFSLVLPPGNDTLNITSGAFDALNQTDANLIQSVKIQVPDSVGFDPSAPVLDRTFTVGNASVSGVVYWNVSKNSTYTPSTDPVVRGATVRLNDSYNVGVVTGVTDPSGTYSLKNVPPGVYNVTVLYAGRSYSEKSTNLSSGSTVQLNLALSPGSVSGAVTDVDGAAYPGATVTLSNSSGVLATATSSSIGDYSFPAVSPGTYTVSAVGLEPSLTSAHVLVAIPKPGANASANLTVEARGTVQVQVQAAGHLVPNASVTLTPLVSFATSPASTVDAVLAASTNATLGTTNGLGVSSVGVPVGLYSMSARARVDGSLWVATAFVNVSGPGVTPTVVATLQPADDVQVNAPSNVTGTSRTAVVAYSASGTQTIAWAVANGTLGTAKLSLPNGSYGFLVLHGGASTGAVVTGGIANANITGAVTLAVPVGPTVVLKATVGTPLGAGKIYPAPNATVGLSAGVSAPALRQLSSSSGTVWLAVPENAPVGSGGYCLSGSALGFAPNTTCGFSGAELQNVTTLGLEVRPVAVTLQVVGLPSGTTVTVTFTAQTLGGRNATLTGTGSFALGLPPGTYGVGAKAVIDGGEKIYLPSTTLSTTIPLGATRSNLTLIVVPQINATGHLQLPAGLEPANVTVALVSPLLNVTVNGTNFTKTTFRATPANYTATVSATYNGVHYVNISRVTLYANNGTIWPKLVLDRAGVAATFTLKKPSGANLTASTPVTLVTSEGLVLSESAVDGTFNASLPAGAYRLYANVTVATVGPNGTYFVDWTAGAGAVCTLSASAPSCSVTMSGTVATVSLRGSLVPAGSTTAVPGVLRLVGPYPTTNVTVISAANGTFSATVLPGAYYGYAASTGGTVLSGFGRLLALPSARLNITITLVPSWSTTFRLSVANPANTSVASATLAVRDAFGDLVTYPAVGVGSSVTVALPTGNYTYSANGSGTLNGVAGTASARGNLSVTNGNLVEDVALTVPVLANITASVVGPDNATVEAGGTASFALTLRNTGNVPVKVHPVGSPSTWAFNFTFSNLSLAIGQSVSEEVRITVPNGTATNHPGISLALTLPNGTTAGTVQPAPTIHVVPYYGLTIGTSSSLPPEVGSTNAVLPFYVVDSGNTFETVRLSVVSADRLASYGWATAWLVNNASVSTPYVNLSAGENTTVALNVTATTTAPVPPGTVTVQLSVVNASGAITPSLVLTFPTPSVRPSPGSVSVTGTSVTSGPPALPVWFVPLVSFVPALALVVGVLTYRWWRTRRWTRR